MIKPSMVDENIALTRGYNMAFGVISKGLLSHPELGSHIFQTLIKNCLVKGNTADEPETRKEAVKSLILAVKTKGISK